MPQSPASSAAAMQPAPAKPLLWSQRLALVRHNLHMSHHTRDYAFFRALQLQTLLSAADHVSALTEALDAAAAAAAAAAATSAAAADPDLALARAGSASSSSNSISNGNFLSSSNNSTSTSTLLDADSVIASLDKLTAVIANVHQDAFSAVALRVRAVWATSDSPHGSAPGAADRRHQIRREVSTQRAVAAASVDKMLDAAGHLVAQLPAHAQDEAVAVLTLGLAFVADAIAVALAQIDLLERGVDDLSQLDAASDTVVRVVSETVSASKAMFGLMNSSVPQPAMRAAAAAAELATTSDSGDRRRKSVAVGADTAATAARSWVRRLSTALTGVASPTEASLPTSMPSASPSATPQASSRKASVVSLLPSQSGPLWHSPDPASVRRAESSDRLTLSRRDETDVHMSSGIAHRLEPLPPTPNDSSGDAMDPFAEAAHVAASGQSTTAVMQQNSRALDSNSLLPIPDEDDMNQPDWQAANVNASQPPKRRMYNVQHRHYPRKVGWIDQGGSPFMSGGAADQPRLSPRPKVHVA